MEIRELARAVLLGTTLEEKLLQPDALTDLAPGPTEPAPEFPGRPAALAVPAGSHANARAAFPDEAELASDSARGRLLHYFANHELLAMELMALVLLRFPDAPPAFRHGLARTIGEEQSHMRLYLERMRELGVEFGELPLSRFFWDAMAQVRSPLDFVVQMSLTFEQANLDFSAHFRDAVARAGDAVTAALLDRVYREEIGHVKHGVVWFNRWRDAGDSDWEAYRKLLPAPMSPRRARGLSYQEDARREAGLSETFIRALAVQGGSRGRPRVVWHYNPLCEAEIARGSPGLVPPASRRQVIRDLEHVPMFLADPQDVVLVEEPPRLAWLEELARAGFAAPDFVRPGQLADTKLGGLEPWGWSPDAVRRFAPFARHLLHTPGGNADWARSLLARGDFAATGLAPLFSKEWSAAWYRRWLEAHPELAPVFGPPDDAGLALTDVPAVRARARELLAAGRGVMLKAPLGTAGTQSRCVTDASELDGPAAGWIARRLDEQRAIVVEPFLDRTSDFSVQLDLSGDGVRVAELRRFITGPRFEYRGTYLGDPRLGFSPEELRFLHEPGPCGRPVERFGEVALAVGQALREAGLRGNAGLDALIFRTSGGLRLRPVVEVNPRWTMGRVAIAIEERMLQGRPGAWFLLPARLLGATRDAQRARTRELAETHAPELTRKGQAPARLSRGLVWTSDPETAHSVLTVLAVGEDAVREIGELFADS